MARKVLGQEKTSVALDYGTNAKHSKLGDKCEPDGIPTFEGGADWWA